MGARSVSLNRRIERIAMNDKQAIAPEDTAVRVALWRAIHVQVDSPPHVLEDEIGLELVAPAEGWRLRPDMHPQFIAPFRASIVGRARAIEDLVAERAADGVGQYVILGAGIDTFAQRMPEIASRLTVFELDQAGPQAWKRQRLIACGYGIPDWLRFVAVDFEKGDFEAGESWWTGLLAAGFDSARPAVVAATGVSMYLTRSAVTAMLRQVAALAPGSTFALSFLLPIEMAEPELRPAMELAVKGAAARGTPFISFFRPEEILDLAREAGFKQVRHVAAAEITQRYFAGRSDGLRPPNNAEELLIATT
jgi:methyltransferase (TIGR00027 family)